MPCWPSRHATAVAALFVCGLFWMHLADSAWAQNASFENPPVDYLKAPVDDAVARLAQKVASGETELVFERPHGYLKSVLEALEIPVSSQTLVFSKTSMQLHRISPSRPRAIYFNDEVYVGWCQQGDFVELASTDARQGAIFYTLKQNSGRPPEFVRDRGQCLVCHASSRTQNVPGYLVRSVYPDRGGQPVPGSGTFTTSMTSPFAERWGGWYVTGQHGQMLHLGNRQYADSKQPIDERTSQNLETLDGIVSTQPYLSDHSDLVALMVLEHQTQMHNAITAASFETREALHQSYEMNEVLGREKDLVSDSARRRIETVAERLVSHLLMCDEFRLESPVSGTSGFAREFQERGIRDSRNHSLRDLDLQTRLFRYPCSYLVYSPSFDALPDPVRTRTIERVAEILLGHDDSDRFSHLTAEMRQGILEILVETKTEFRQVFAHSERDTPDLPPNSQVPAKCIQSGGH